MSHLKTLARAFVREETGATMIEYALLVVLIAMVVALAAITLGQAISTQFGNVKNCVSAPTATSC
jgi:Flp pilus assembly pilin Flp